MSDELQLLKRQLSDEQKKVEVLQKKLSHYETDSTIRGFYSLNRILNQQVDLLNAFELEKEVKTFSKDDKVWDRIEAMWTKLNTMISNINTLKVDLKITGNEEKDKRTIGFVEGIAEKRQ